MVTEWLIGSCDEVRYTTMLCNLYRTVIRGTDNVVKASEVTPDILDCDHFRSFWIKWTVNEVLVGRGTIVWEHLILT